MSYSNPTSTSTSTSTRQHATSAPTDASRTITITNDPTKEGTSTDDENKDRDRDSGEPIVGALKLRGARRRTGPKVAWDEEVIDNEHLGKKKSKICCIYHKPRRFDESSSESSDSDVDSDSSCGGTGHQHNHDHNHQHNHNHSHTHRPQGSNDVKQYNSGSEDNSYERQPKYNGKGKHKAV